MAVREEGNDLLAALAPEHYALLRGHLEKVHLRPGYKCVAIARPVEHVYFPSSGLVTRPVGGCDAAYGDLYGRDGFTGASLVLGVDCPYVEDVVGTNCIAERVRAHTLVELAEAHPAIRAMLTRFVHVLHVQAAYTLVSQRTCDLRGRLARLLLMCHDRNNGDELLLTHGFLARVLGVHRPSLTATMHELEGDHSLKATRACIRIKDRDQLKQLAKGTYGVPEAEHAKLILDRSFCWRDPHKQ